VPLTKSLDSAEPDQTIWPYVFQGVFPSFTERPAVQGDSEDEVYRADDNCNSEPVIQQFNQTSLK